MTLTKGQLRCIDTLDVPLVVAAGAGSGKTFTLTKRIVEALIRGAVSDIDEVCAITFTKKAAAELKSRIKGELRARGLVEQALKVDEAWISTIHGMCARILRAHAIELGIDPAFEVAEGARVDEYLSRAVDSVLTAAQVEGSGRLDALFEAYRPRSSGGFGVSVEGMLTQLVREAAAQADGVNSFVLPGATAEPRFAVEQALGVIDELLALAAEEKESASRNTWIAETEAQVSAAREALEHGISSPAEALAVMAPFKLAKTFGSGDYKARVDEGRAVFGASIMEVRLSAARGYLETLVDLAEQTLELFGQIKREDGVLDNSDLLVMAARAIEEHPSIAERYADKFKLVMVDEFQDTDQMQVDMIKRLSGEGARRLCVVGDAQQSIYRFRGADVSVYRKHLESIRAEWSDSVIKLADNFRSHADVLAFVDRVFEKPDMFGGEFMSLAAGRDEDKVAVPFEASRPRVKILHTTQPGRGGNARQAVETAARRIAGEFAALRDAGHKPGEMVVLLGRMVNSDVYAQALRDAGLSCVISGGSVFSRTGEVKVIRELVRVIANPHETQSLFNVLTSPILGLSAGDLLEVGGLEGFWRAAGDLGTAPDHPSSRLECALRVMKTARETVGEVEVSRIVETVATDSGWLSRLEREGAEGLASAGNVFKAIRQIAGIERSGATGPVSVMRQFDNELDGSKEAPGALSVSGGNSVRIMTIHASKGLEFPIVAVAEIKEDRGTHERLLSSAIEGKVYLSLDLGSAGDDGGGKVDLNAVRDYVLGDVAGEDELAVAVQEEAGALHRRLALGDYIAEGDAEEAKRLLYVALTRAKEAVVVASTGKRTKDNPTGVPKSALAGVFGALDAGGAALGEGRSEVEFGGSLPAVVECVALAPGGEDCDAETAAGEVGEPNVFMVPAADCSDKPNRVAYRPLRDGVFSYSSISDASHEGDVLDRLVDVGGVTVDQACDDDARDGMEPRFGDEDAPVGYERRSDDSQDGDDFWDVGPSQAFDEDRATDLGTAFHRLAQYAVVVRPSGTELVVPPADRIEALSRTCNLDDGQRHRLSRALGRWFGCDLAHEMATLPQLDAEVPFFVSVDGAYLEGEIDLIGFDASREHAFVVDYKTGGNSGETEGSLQRKHVLQAACYAYAVLRQGAESVDAAFVRVERGRADDESQPQCVRYRFSAGDLPMLERSIAEVYARLAEC